MTLDSTPDGRTIFIKRVVEVALVTVSVSIHRLKKTKERADEETFVNSSASVRRNNFRAARGRTISKNFNRFTAPPAPCSARVGSVRCDSLTPVSRIRTITVFLNKRKKKRLLEKLFCSTIQVFSDFYKKKLLFRRTSP